MKPKLYSSLTIAVFAIAFFFSCGKKGDPGPAGPAGPTGAAGAAGAAGPAGPAGTANVIYSAWSDATFTIFSMTNVAAPNADTLWSTTISASKLTSDILTKGSVQLYFNFGTAAAPDIVSVPYTDFWTGLNITSDYEVGSINIYSVNANLTTQGTGTNKVGQWRYVLIPGGTPASVAPGLKWSDYNSVKKYYNLPD